MDLITAVKENNLVEVQRLSTPENINESDEYGCTALHYAAEGGNIEILNILLKCNPTIDTQNILNDTPLMRAVIKKHCAIVEKLLESGADPNIQNQRGYTSVHIAALENSFDLVSLLVQYKGDIKVKTKNNSTILHCAATGITEERSNKWELVKWLLSQGVETNATNNDGISVIDVFRQQDLSYVQNYEKLVTLLADSFSIIH